MAVTVTVSDIIDGYPPEHAPGHKVEWMLKRIPIMQKCVQHDAGDWDGYSTDDFFNVPDDTFIKQVLVYISEAFTNSVTLTIGDGTDPDGIMDSTAIAPQAAGWKSSYNDAQPLSGGKYYATADTLDIVLGGATPTAGTIDIYVEYVRNWSELGLAP